MNRQVRTQQRVFLQATGAFAVAAAMLVSSACTGPEAATTEQPGGPGAAYHDMPAIAPIGVRIGRYMEVPASAKGPSIDPGKGYRTQDLGRGLYMVTENVYQSMFLVYETGVVVVDAPPSYAAHIRRAIDEVSKNPITHVIYSHSHVDHIAG